MTSIRVHSIQSQKSGFIPYLTMRIFDEDQVLLTFRDLKSSSIQNLEVALSSDEIYRILEGHAMQIRSETILLDLSVERDQLLILISPHSQSATTEFRLWMSELALAWNLLCNSTPHS